MKNLWNRQTLAVFFFGVALNLFSSCSHRFSDVTLLETLPEYRLTTQGGIDSLSVHFYGLAAFAFRYKNTILLTDPFYSRPAKRQVLFGRLNPEPEAMQRVLDDSPSDLVKAIVVGHGHYDHMMDLPPLLNFTPSDALVLGSKTVGNVLAPALEGKNFIGVNPFAAAAEKPGQWLSTPDNSLRIKAIESGHPPHFLNKILYYGPQNHPESKLPRKTSHWKCGQPFSYLLDFLDGDKIAFRLFFQSSSATGDYGLPDLKDIQQHPVDLT